MNTNWLLQKAAGTSRNRLILASLVVAGGLAWLATQAGYFREYFQGPTTVQAAALEKMSSPEAAPRRWVRVQAQRVEDLGLTEVTVRSKRGVERSRSVSAAYFAAVLDNKVLLVRMPAEDKPPTLLEGELVPMDQGAANALFQGKDGAAMRQAFLPMELKVHSFRERGNWMLVIGGMVLVWMLYYGGTGYLRMRDPQSHPAVRQASRWGPLDALVEVIREDTGNGLEIKGWRLGRRYLLRTSMLNVELHNLDELLWVYREVTKKKIYYVIPAGQTHAMVLKWRDASVRIEAKEDAVTEGLARIAESQPWLAFGWSKEVETLYNKKRIEFVRHVAEARKQWASQQQFSREAAPTEPAGLAPA